MEDLLDGLTPLVSTIAGATIIIVTLVVPVENDNIAIAAIGSGSAIAGAGGGYLAGKNKRQNN